MVLMAVDFDTGVAWGTSLPDCGVTVRITLRSTPYSLESAFYLLHGNYVVGLFLRLGACRHSKNMTVL
jgi:hypothetical protein